VDEIGKSLLALGVFGPMVGMVGCSLGSWGYYPNFQT